jgi:hypothetical protein
MVVRGASRDEVLALPLTRPDILACRKLAVRETGGVPSAGFWLDESTGKLRSEEGCEEGCEAGGVGYESCCASPPSAAPTGGPGISCGRSGGSSADGGVRESGPRGVDGSSASVAACNCSSGLGVAGFEVVVVDCPLVLKEPDHNR